MIEVTKIAVSFHCGTRDAFSTHSCQAMVVTNVNMVIQKVGKGPEQNLIGHFAEFKH